jgi:hypothetical protein
MSLKPLLGSESKVQRLRLKKWRIGWEAGKPGGQKAWKLAR